MSRWECLSCGGVYEDVLPDGMLYFHACPPTRAHPTDSNRTIPIPKRRNENVIGGEGEDRRNIRAKGKGRKGIP